MKRLTVIGLLVAGVVIGSAGISLLPIEEAYAGGVVAGKKARSVHSYLDFIGSGAGPIEIDSGSNGFIITDIVSDPETAGSQHSLWLKNEDGKIFVHLHIDTNTGLTSYHFEAGLPLPPESKVTFLTTAEHRGYITISGYTY